MRQLAHTFGHAADERLLVGLQSPDDAAVFRLSADQALIQTTDFFTPVVDDPYTYGAIAAANALSDVYAMGGEVLFALNVAGKPEALPTAALAAVLAGGAAKVQEAGAVVAGGHTITSPELFYGLSVTGQAHPERLFRKGELQAGDHLFLSKPLGTGLITSADIVDSFALVAEADLQAAIHSMLQLNAPVAGLARRFGVRTATDISGFGLLGHSQEMLQNPRDAAAVGIHIAASRVPLLPHVRDYVAAGVATRAGKTNQSHFGSAVKIEEGVESSVLAALWEAETSGGLLVAVPADQASDFSQAGHDEGVAVWYVGLAVAGRGVTVVQDIDSP